MTKVIELKPGNHSDAREILKPAITDILVERGRLDNVARETIDRRIDAALEFISLCIRQPLPRGAPPINVALPEAQAEILEQALRVQRDAIVEQCVTYFMEMLPAIVAGRSR